MRNDHVPFLQRKTTWAALASVAAGIIGMQTGQVDTSAGAQMITQAIIALGLRSAINRQ
jgi:hypothetical protein